MDDKLWELIEAYGYWSYHAGLQYGLNNIQQYELFTKNGDDALDKIKRHLTSRSSRAAGACAECEWRPTKPGWKCITITCEHWPPPA